MRVRARSRRCPRAAAPSAPPRPAARSPRRRPRSRGTGATPRGRGGRARATRAGRRSGAAAGRARRSRRSARARVSPLPRLELVREEGGLAVDHEAGAHLEDVRALAEQASVLHHLRAPPSRLDHHLRPGAVARLERARREQRELTLRGAEERRPPAEERPVEVRVDAPDAPLRVRADGRVWRPLDRRFVAVVEQAALGGQPLQHRAEHLARHRGEGRQRLVAVAPDRRGPPAPCRRCRRGRRGRAGASRSRRRSPWRTGAARRARAGRPPRRRAAARSRPARGRTPTGAAGR